MKYEEINVVIVLRLLIIRCTAERRDMFYTHCLIINSSIKFIYKICLSYEFSEFRSYQQLNLIEEVLNEGCFKSLIIKVVMFNGNAQKFSIIFLKTVILLFTDLQFKLNFYN